MRVAVIGAGASGLVTLKQLLRAHIESGTDEIDAWLFEKESEIGGTFRYRTYEEGELVSSRFLTSFSDYRIPDDLPDFVSTDTYCEYLADYSTHFKLWPRIKLNTTVDRIRRNEKGRHVITYRSADSADEQQWTCDAVAICSGLNITPNIPTVPGIERIPEVLHSSVFKKREQFGKDKNVVILGAGETSMDVAYLAITAPTRTVTVCHRGGWKNEPKRLPDAIWFGRKKAHAEDIERNGVAPPTDTAFASFFDSAYQHPMLEAGRWPWEYYDKFTWFYAWLTTGVGTGIDQWAGEVQGERHHARYGVANKSNRTCPYISVPYKPKVPGLIERVRAWVCSLPPLDLKGRHIDLAPWPSEIDENGVIHFIDNGRPEAEMMRHRKFKPDVVVFCTGYTQVFPFLDESYPTIFDADIRRIWKSGVEDVAFIGFARPAFGAIPPLAELQAQLWIRSLFDQLPQPIEYRENFLLKHDAGRRLDYIVDHETYAYTLAKDMGAAPSIFQVLSFGLTVFGTWALGPNFNTKFRLVGPWKWDGAAEVMRGEQWNVIRRRKDPLIWLLMGFVPLTLFGVLSLIYFVYYGIKDTLLWPLRRLHLTRGRHAMGAARLVDPMGAKRAKAEREAKRPSKIKVRREY